MTDQFIDHPQLRSLFCSKNNVTHVCKAKLTLCHKWIILLSYLYLLILTVMCCTCRYPCWEHTLWSFLSPVQSTKHLELCDLSFSLFFPFSSSLSCISARNRPEPSEGETDKPKDGQQVGKCSGVYWCDTERGAGVLHTWRPLQSPALTCVWLPGRGMTACLFCFNLVHL